MYNMQERITTYWASRGISLCAVTVSQQTVDILLYVVGTLMYVYIAFLHKGKSIYTFTTPSYIHTYIHTVHTYMADRDHLSNIF